MWISILILMEHIKGENLVSPVNQIFMGRISWNAIIGCTPELEFIPFLGTFTHSVFLSKQEDYKNFTNRIKVIYSLQNIKIIKTTQNRLSVLFCFSAVPNPKKLYYVIFLEM